MLYYIHMNKNDLHIAFFADTHIGYRAKVASNSKGINIRVQDGYDALHEIITQIIENGKITTVIIGGDLFHYSHPTIRDITTVQYYFRLLVKNNIKVYVLAGNHDATDIKSELAAVAAMDDRDRNIFAVYKPYEKFEIADNVLLHMMSHHGLHGEDAPSITPEVNALNIFSTHGAALDPKNQSLLRCADSPREQIIPVDLIVDDLFQLKLLGHYHSRYTVGATSLNTWYSGSTLRRRFSDAPGPRGWLEVAFDGNGNPTITPHDIHQRPQYDLPEIDATDLSASDIMDLIEENIATTHNADTEDERNAPIIRQRILNTSRSVRDSLDRKKINELTSFALDWQLLPRTDEATDKKVQENLSMKGSKDINIVSNYSEWIKKEAQSVPGEFRDIVVADAEKYLMDARNKSLEDNS